MIGIASWIAIGAFALASGGLAYKHGIKKESLIKSPKDPEIAKSTFIPQTPKRKKKESEEVTKKKKQNKPRTQSRNKSATDSHQTNNSQESRTNSDKTDKKSSTVNTSEKDDKDENIGERKSILPRRRRVKKPHVKKNYELNEKQKERLKKEKTFKDLLKKFSRFKYKIYDCHDKLMRIIEHIEKVIKEEEKKGDSSVRWKEEKKVDKLKFINKRLNLITKLLQKTLESLVKNEEEIFSYLQSVIPRMQEMINLLEQNRMQNERILESTTPIAKTWNQLYEEQKQVMERLQNRFKDLDNEIREIWKKVGEARHNNSAEFLYEEAYSIDLIQSEEEPQDIDKWIRKYKHLDKIDNNTIQEIMNSFNYFIEKQRLITKTTSEKVVFVGDIHGDLSAIIKTFQLYPPESHTYVFCGDYVDKGHKSLHCLLYLMMYKIKYPDRFFILQGNHEGVLKHTFSAEFWFEIIMENKEIGLQLFRIASNLPLSIVINNEIVGLHAVLPKLNRLEDLNNARPNDQTWYTILYGRYKEATRAYMRNKGINTESGQVSDYSIEYLNESLEGKSIKYIVRGHINGQKGFMYREQFKNGEAKALVITVLTSKFSGIPDAGTMKGRLVCVYDKTSSKKFELIDIDSRRSIDITTPNDQESKEI
jgi:hypothetical protein